MNPDSWSGCCPRAAFLASLAPAQGPRASMQLSGQSPGWLGVLGTPSLPAWFPSYSYNTSLPTLTAKGPVCQRN